MVKEKNDKYFIEKIIESIDKIEATYKDKTIENLIYDIDVNNIIMFQFLLIGENSIRLSDEYKKRKNKIQWNKIKGLRNIVVHDYTGVKYNLIEDTIKNDLKLLKEELLNDL